jgi:hypothetical protein
LYGDYSVGATVKTMVAALEESDRDVPDYLRALQTEAESAQRTRKATFGMYWCDPD